MRNLLPQLATPWISKHELWQIFSFKQDKSINKTGINFLTALECIYKMTFWCLFAIKNQQLWIKKTVKSNVSVSAAINERKIMRWSDGDDDHDTRPRTKSNITHCRYSPLCSVPSCHPLEPLHMQHRCAETARKYETKTQCPYPSPNHLKERQKKRFVLSN